jgi:hypothetical protein
MAIKTESLAKLLVRLKVAADEVAAKELITSKDESDVTLPTGLQIFSDDELATRDNSNKATYTKAGTEISVKQLKELAGLVYDGEGSKDPKKFIEEYAKKVLADANIHIDEKLTEREKTIAKLRENIKAMETTQTENETKVKTAKQDYDLLTWIHDIKPDYLEDKELVGIIKMNNELFEENGQMFVKRNGEVVKDQKLQTPIPAKDAIRSFMTDRKLVKAAPAAGNEGAGGEGGGRGAGDSKGNTGGILTMTQFNEHLEKNNINPKSQEATALITKIAGANANFDFNH